jgi:hypothetical protein
MAELIVLHRHREVGEVASRKQEEALEILAGR